MIVPVVISTINSPRLGVSHIEIGPYLGSIVIQRFWLWIHVALPVYDVGRPSAVSDADCCDFSAVDAARSIDAKLGRKRWSQGRDCRQRQSPEDTARQFVGHAPSPDRRPGSPERMDECGGPQAAVTSASIIVPSASILAARQNRSKLACTSANASSTAPVAGEPAGVISLVMALLSFVESAPRAYRLKVGNADLFRNSTEPGTSPAHKGGSREPFQFVVHCHMLISSIAVITVP